MAAGEARKPRLVLGGVGGITTKGKAVFIEKGSRRILENRGKSTGF